ncbi:hypothetical protein CPB84DRAFT_1796499 [Gymnopilus junonius]|uniref:Uncharacterized protein n=1 Tax=Gymnopilus junonius TaxID=109634 RepID=A0A9P5N9H2_GYMJU|nr:hypothetical protein CPB84DRAFT_1796499 [Gymnopilus junonius]
MSTAWACVTGIGAILGGMYWMTKDVKKREDLATPYAKTGQGLGGTDKTMTSADISAVVTGSQKPAVGGGKQSK